MKRNKELNKSKRRHSTSYLQGGGDSKYARKVKSGKQMYGPGCCGHGKKPS